MNINSNIYLITSFKKPLLILLDELSKLFNTTFIFGSRIHS
jgi:hypothetical protein